MLDLTRLENVRSRGSKIIARCPACAEMGADSTGEHLFIADDGRGPFGCVTAQGPDGEAHRARIWALAGSDMPSAPRHAPIPPWGCPRLPALWPLTVAEMARIAAARSWPAIAGMELLTRRGLLWHGEVFDDGRTWPAWVITDSARRNAQARRLDGGLWAGIGEKKAKTLPGSDASWPIGAPEIGERGQIMLCEGGPDFLAALLVAWWERENAVDAIAPVCMAGAGVRICDAALSYFKGRRVRIAVHADDAGMEAAQRWADQLWRAGAAHVDGFDFAGALRRNGHPVKDLADYAMLLDLEEPAPAEVLANL